MSKIYNPNDLVLLNEYKAFEGRQKRFRFGYEKNSFFL